MPALLRCAPTSGVVSVKSVPSHRVRERPDRSPAGRPALDDLATTLEAPEIRYFVAPGSHPAQVDDGFVHPVRWCRHVSLHREAALGHRNGLPHLTGDVADRATAGMACAPTSRRASSSWHRRCLLTPSTVSLRYVPPSWQRPRPAAPRSGWPGRRACGGSRPARRAPALLRRRDLRGRAHPTGAPAA